MERKPLRPTSLSVSSTTTGSPTEGLLKESGDTGESGEKCMVEVLCCSVLYRW